MDNSTSQLFSLKWNNYLSHIMDAFEVLRNEENLVDVTLSCEGYKIKAHKMLLSACSSYFKDLFKDNPCQHPIIVFRNVRYSDLRALIDFIYQGEVNVMQDQLASFLATAKLLEVKGLTDNLDSGYEGTGNHDTESFDDENASEHIEDDEAEEEENLSDASQYAQPTYTQEMTSGPLTIIPLNKNTPETTITEYTTTRKKRKQENDDDAYHRRSFLGNTKPPQKMIPHNDLSSTLSFKTKQSVEIFPVPALKSEKGEESYMGEGSLKDITRIDRLPECEIQGVNMDTKIKMETMEDNYAKSHIELNHLLSKSALGAGDNSVAQDSFQGHWLSSLNNDTESSELLANEANVTIGNRKPADANVDYSQQRHRYICSICGATYKHLRNLRAHCHLHYGKTRCNLCNKVLCNISYFKKHLQQQHGMLSTKKSDTKNLSSPSVALPSS